jgi:hypothetical protein
MSASTARKRETAEATSPNLTVIAGEGAQYAEGQPNPYYMSQSYNISASDPPDVYVTLPYPNDGNYGWRVKSMTGDLGCVYMWQWGPGEGAPIARAVLTFRHQGQLTVIYESCGNGNIPPGGDVLYFTVFAC